MHPIKNILTILVVNHPGIILVEFGQIPISGLGEVIQSFPYLLQCKIVTSGLGQF